MRTLNINAALQKKISLPRLKTYHIETNNNLDASITLYEKNMRLSEAFYIPLQSLEICLRNTIDECMCNRYGVDWFTNNNAPLSSAAKDEINEAYSEIKKPPPVYPGDAVAELKFAFWVSLLGPKYDSTLWRQSLYKGFQVGKGQKRRDVHERLNTLRRFRNRVAHHEPIFKSNLNAVHDEIMEAIGWMCRDTMAWAAHHSRVVTVLNSDRPHSN